MAKKKNDTKLKSTSYIKTAGKNKFSSVSWLEVSKIKTEPKIFQGRSVPFAGETVDKITREGFDTSQDPIVLFKNNKENIVISGHSRFEAAKKLKLAKIPVKFFNGDFEDAVDFAVIESNRSGKIEGIESDIKAYVRAVERGYNKEFLRSIFKEDSYINTLRNLSFLDPRGEFITNLRKTSARSFPYLLRNSDWIGQLRREYVQLTNNHEKEFFNYFYLDNGKGLKIRKHELFDKVKKKYERFDFDPKKPLNIASIKSTATGNTRGVQYYNSMVQSIESWLRERTNKEVLIARAKIEGKEKEIPALKKRIEQITTAIINKQVERIKFGDKLKTEQKKQARVSLFG